MKSHNRLFSLILITLILIAAITALSLTPAPQQTSQTYLTLYIIGTTLESGQNLATDTLKTLADTWDSTAGDILIAYGGADKPGWNTNITITNITLLKQDLLDETIGTDNGQLTTHILTRLNTTTMADPQALADYLLYSQTYQTKHHLTNANTILLFWGHGYGPEGYGPNKYLEPPLTTTDIRIALSTAHTSSQPYDLIIFDSCLMASLELADNIHPYATLLLASEELIPLGGLNYTALTSSPGTTPQDLGLTLIHSYMNTTRTPKTLSLINLTQIPRITEQLNHLGDQLTDKIRHNPSFIQTLNHIYNTTQGFGSLNKTSIVTTTINTIDLSHYLQNLKAHTQNTSIRQTIDELQQTLQTCIIHTENDGPFIATGGITIASPTEYYHITLVPDTITLGNQGWKKYLTAYLNDPDATSRPIGVRFTPDTI